jgi:hypothetical protein
MPCSKLSCDSDITFERKGCVPVVTKVLPTFTVSTIALIILSSLLLTTMPIVSFGVMMTTGFTATAIIPIKTQRQHQYRTSQLYHSKTKPIRFEENVDNVVYVNDRVR